MKNILQPLFVNAYPILEIETLFNDIPVGSFSETSARMPQRYLVTIFIHIPNATVADKGNSHAETALRIW
jgi:hypothetical protein